VTLDSLGMHAAALALPEQVADAAASVEQGIDGLPDRERVSHVLALGMGGSGIAGDVLSVVAGPFVPVPISIAKDYELPGYVGERTLVFAISFSGNSEETVEAATEANALGAFVVPVTAGGELARLAGEWGRPVLGVPPGIPMPRAGLGALAVPPLLALEQIGLFPGARGWVQAAVEQLERRRDQLAAAGNAAEALARRIGRTMPIVYGAGPIGAVAAMRWKCDVNENAKAPAFYNRVPELCHNEIAGWGQHGDVTRQVFTIVNLRHDHEHPHLARRFELMNSLEEEVVGGIEEVRAEGEGPLAQLFDLVLYGDLMSIAMAEQAGVDPGPIAALEFIKQALAGS
jgi:glucose/mannose-6-phosphate isomerase